MADQGFSDQIGKTLAFEGGYVDDPADPGGETNFGISRRAYPTLNIRGLTRQAAIEIYKRDYWDAFGLSRLPPAIGAKVFDLGVNMGTVTAIKLMQRAAIGALTGGEFRVDGKIGPLTLAAVAAADTATLLAGIRTLAAARYENIITRNPAMARFRGGWLRRAAA